MERLLCLFFIVSLCVVSQGGKLMDKVFQCDAKMKEAATATKRSSEAKPSHHARKTSTIFHQTLVLDAAAKSREQIAKAEANMKRHYFQGDMILTPQQESIIKKAILFQHKKRENFETRAMIKDVAKLWPKGVVSYAFSDPVDEEGKNVALAAMKHWMDNTCVKFVPRKSEEDYVEFQFGDGCASRVGRLGGRQEILIGSVDMKCKVGNLIHELGHTLGFFHEHSRPDRDDFVAIEWPNVKDGYQINFEKMPAAWIDSRDVRYDYGSIMHYPRTIFGKMPWAPTIALKQATGANVGQRVKLSDLDILQAKKLYGCGGLSSKTRR